jgi:hypothetical protein
MSLYIYYRGFGGRCRGGGDGSEWSVFGLNFGLWQVSDIHVFIDAFPAFVETCGPIDESP